MAGYRIAYLACKYCLPDSAERRSDAYEHDREMQAFRPAFAQYDMDLVDVDWETIDPENALFDLYLVRTTWNYVANPHKFVSRLKEFQAYAPVYNDPGLIEWNMSKQYLRELDSKGFSIIPSAFTEKETDTLQSLRDKLGTSDLVLKPIYGGGGFGQRITNSSDDGSEVLTIDVFAQPFVPEIKTNGELSFIFVGEEFSHCVRKLPASGEYLIHSYHGGSELTYYPSSTEIHEARHFLKALPQKALITRVDIVPTKKGGLLMELEVIEPHLFPQFGDKISNLLASAVKDLISD